MLYQFHVCSMVARQAFFPEGDCCELHSRLCLPAPRQCGCPLRGPGGSGHRRPPSGHRSLCSVLPPGPTGRSLPVGSLTQHHRHPPSGVHSSGRCLGTRGTFPTCQLCPWVWLSPPLILSPHSDVASRCPFLSYLTPNPPYPPPRKGG